MKKQRKAAPSEVVHVRMASAIVERLRERADQERRSMNNVIAIILEHAVDEAPIQSDRRTQR